MMKKLIIGILILLTLWHSILAHSIAKRDCCNSCDTKNCNSCNGNNCNTCNTACCSSASCNKCVNECSSGCSTQSCQKNCVTGCSTSCQTQSCDQQPCSQCINRCSNQCLSDKCVDKCTKSCDCKEKEIEPIIIEPAQPANVVVNNTNVNLVNLTTQINIDNKINNFNNITIPVYVNTTNINNINLSLTDNETKPNPERIVVRNDSTIIVRPFPYPIPYPIIQPQPENNCCYVMHPRTCYTDDESQRRCYVRRHVECSDACTSPVVTIQRNELANSGCHYIRNYPYVYCGNYERRDCGQCYTCGGTYNPSECFRRRECPDVCRTSIPNCVPSQFGLQCY